MIRGAALVGLVAVVGAVAAIAVSTRGDAAGPRSQPDPAAPATAFLAAWHAGDYSAMYDLVAPDVQASISRRKFAHEYKQVARTASMTGLRAEGRLHATPAEATIPVSVATALFGRLSEQLELPLVRLRRRYMVAWTPALTFPGLRPGETLQARVHAPEGRGRILARDGTVLAEGPPGNRTYPAGTAFALMTGFTKPPEADAIAARRKAGWPAGRRYGQGGLEESLDAALGGLPRVRLVAAPSAPGSPGRILARKAGRKPKDVVTTIDPGLQAAAATALGSRYGGIVVLDPRSGAVRADAGLGMDATQPPGSSFKTVTASAALAAGKVSLTSTYPYEKYVILNGWRLRNFHHELCGGSFVQAFADSCNSVFAPVADQVGAKGLVAMANAFGFNHQPTIAYPAPESTTRKPAQMPSDLSLGVAGIGQGGVVASPLQMASVAQTIAADGIRHPPFIVHSPKRFKDRQPPVKAVGRGVAGEVTQLMEAVVSYGTGTSAAIPGITVAGKTGTAEVGPDRPSDAWFIAFAPAQAPRVAIAVLIVNGGVGGDVAAPIARQVLESALAG
ncbi:MAG TPA: penicillin-binding transpeptidase domain-containing protein [Gaiellales bacterium]|jgi:penicillin-binding protein A|nr:penicillin-binding transpeptidase domain-containing protein [Gaiellales bacterium]